MGSILLDGQTIPVRNETGSTLAKGTAVAVIGFNVVEGLPIVDLADKDDPAKRPAVGVLEFAIANNANGVARIGGTLEGVDTSAFAQTDQLVLGAAGALIRPFPETAPFIGEIQHIGSVSRVDATLGEIGLAIGGLDQVFGLNFDHVISLPRSTTTLSTFQTKASLVLPADVGNYFVAWHAAVDTPGGNIPGEFRLQNQTDGLTIGVAQVKTDVAAGTVEFVGSFNVLLLTGTSKTLAIEFRDQAGGNTQGIQDAGIAIWKAPV